MRWYPFRFRAMGSPCELQVYADDPDQARGAADLVRADIALLEARYSRYRDDSLLAAINRAAARGDAVEVDAETAGLLDYAAACYAQSDGLFDITAGLLRRVWSFAPDSRLPDPAAVAALLPLIGWQRLRWYPPRLEFSVAGMELDLGGIVKEYAADRAGSLLLEQGLTRGLVNLGGDIRVVGPHGDDRSWNIGIRHPRQPDGCLAQIQVRQGAVASSGDYERCLEDQGRRYGHILDPRSGWPVTGLAAVTVLAPCCLVAGSAATIGMLKGRDGPAWLAELGLPHLWMDSDGCLGGNLSPSEPTADAEPLSKAAE